jgi:hypothetical protein
LIDISHPLLWLRVVWSSLAGPRNAHDYCSVRLLAFGDQIAVFLTDLPLLEFLRNGASMYSIPAMDMFLDNTRCSASTTLLDKRCGALMPFEEHHM